MTGRHLEALGELFSPFEVQMLTGIFKGDISRLTSARHIDDPINDVCCSFVIRTLLQFPEWAPLPKLKNHSDLLERLKELPDSFPLPSFHTYSGVYIGRSSATSYSLNRGSNEMAAISMWITILLNNFAEFSQQGKDHFLYKLMEEEAYSRNLHGLNSVVMNRGWPKVNPEVNETGKQIPRITGRDIKLLQKDPAYRFDNIQLQYLLGSFMSYVAVNTEAKNIDLPLADATRSLIIRYLKQYPEKALLPKFVEFDEFLKVMQKLDGKLPFPSYPSKLGVILGRGISTINALKAKKRRNMPVVSVWSTIVMNQLDDMLTQGDQHPIYRAIHQEAQARDISLIDVVLHGGWPSTRMKK